MANIAEDPPAALVDIRDKDLLELFMSHKECQRQAGKLTAERKAAAASAGPTHGSHRRDITYPSDLTVAAGDRFVRTQSLRQTFLPEAYRVAFRDYTPPPGCLLATPDVFWNLFLKQRGGGMVPSPPLAPMPAPMPPHLPPP